MLNWCVNMQTKRNPDGEMLLSFIIVMTNANELMKKIHNRMPVILN
jgi:putative SOS response-associated peptidase YedK